MPAAPDPKEWLRKPIHVIRAADRDVIAALDQARRDIEAQLAEIDRRFSGRIGEAVRRQQLYMVKRNLQLEEAKLLRKVGDVARARRLEAISRVLDLHEATDRHLLVDVAKMGGLGNQIAKAIALAERDAAERAIDRMIVRMNGQSYVPLSDRVYNSTTRVNGQIDRMVNSALSRGLSAREFAREARDFINPNTPGGLRYASLRLARTEINNAAHAVSIDAVQDKPWVDSMKLHLSGSHPKPDVCDQLAHGGKKGDGVYPKDDVPSKPHPQCFCYVTPETPDDAEFLDNLLAGHYNDYLKRYSESRGRTFNESILIPKRPTPVQPHIVPLPKPFKLPPVPRTVTSTPKAVRTPKLDKVKGIGTRGGVARADLSRKSQIVYDAYDTNPKYKPGTNYSVNCTHCVNAFELRARGYDVTASALPDRFQGRGRHSQELLDKYVLPDGRPHNRRIGFFFDFSHIERIVGAWPDGARGWVQVAWKNGGAHIFNVEKVDGKIRWIEAQTGKPYAEIDRYKLQADPSLGWGVARLDDLVPTDGVLQFTA